VAKGPFIATQLNSTRRRVEMSCVAINGPLEALCFLSVRPTDRSFVCHKICEHDILVHWARAWNE